MNKKHLTVLNTLCTLVLILSIMIPSVDALATDRHHSDEYIDIIVRYHEETPDEEDLDPDFKNIRTMTLMPVQMMSVPASSVKEISQMENVSRVTYDQEMTTTQSSHSQTINTDDWNQDMIGAFDAREEGVTGQNVRVAVLDTGFYDHEEITYAGGYSIFNGEDADPWTNDHHGHGTHVASIIGAHHDTRAQGVAPGVDLFGVKVYHEKDGDSTHASNLMEGLQWAINNDMDIINISSGYSSHNEEVYNMIQLADSEGILVVAASGNSTDSNTSIDYPAKYEEVIAVANVDQDQFHAYDSMVGPENELAAPGRNVLGLDNEPGGYDYMSGTSQATPHVAGIAALLMQKYPEESARNIRARMTQKARDLGPEGRDPLYGYGLVHFLEETVEDPEPVEEDEDPAETDESEEPSEEDTPDADDSEDLEENDNETEEVADEEDSESESPTETEEDTDTGDDENNDVEETEEEDEDALLTTVWIRPSDTNGIATIDDDDISAVADSGVLAISFDSSLEHLQRVSLTSEQVSMIRERNITLLIARIDMEWVIPANNLVEGNALLSFESLQSTLDYSGTAKSEVIEFSIEQNGQQVTAFPNEMAYRFFTDEAEINQDYLYEWNTAQGEWILLGDTYTNGGVVGNTASVGIFAVFNSEELTSAILSGSEDTEQEEPEEAEESVSAEEVSAEEDESDESSETTRSSFGETETEVPVVIAGAVVIMTTVGGGFYFFGGKSKQ